MTTSDPLPSVTGDPAQAELSRLRAERDAALNQLERQRRHRVTGGVVRRVVVGLLVFLVAVLVPVTATAAWAKRTVLDTGTYVSTVAPIASDPAVTEAVARTVTNEVFAALDPQARVAEVLPPRAAFLAAPITTSIKGFVQDKVNAALDSPTFQQIWTKANEVAHTALTKLLEGDAKALETTNGYVVLNLVPLLNQVLATIGSQVSALLNRPISLPTLSGDELPAVACQKISTALGRPLPETCGQIPLFPAEKLTQARHAVSTFENLVVALLVVTPLLAVAALLLTRRRRRTLIQLAVGVAIGMVVLRRTVMWLQNTLETTGRPENKAARTAILDQVLHGFFTTTVWILAVTLAVVVVAVVTGPYAWAVTARTRTAAGARVAWQWTRVAFGRAQGAVGGGWVPAHADALKVAGAVVAVLLVLILDVSWIGLLVIAALTAVWEVWLYRIGSAAGAAGGPPGTPPPVRPA